ncbi:hypothetical protein [Nocardioides sp. TF02-7]|uniref:hypothetical protein n=1 Tax=Nocardioides sp. TF02-7 TaxID=2917724 RepID=UPI001F05CDD3|nr:hypothetical protein [Nocardioides sp. TF02-7]UMG94242.1 hypothetical protein MF408_09605 [Nocardioides sp. TF02-7]
MPAVTARLGRALASGRLLAVTLALPAALLAAVPAVSSTPVPPGDASTGAPAAGAPAAPATDVTETHVVRVDRRTALVATAPERVRVGRAVVVRGTVEVRAGARARKRPLVFAERRDGSWRVVRRAMSRRLGDFRVVLPGSATAGTRVLEVRAPRSSGLRAVRVRVRVAVVATTVPQAPPQPEAPGPWQADDAPADPRRRSASPATGATPSRAAPAGTRAGRSPGPTTPRVATPARSTTCAPLSTRSPSGRG